MGCRKARSEKLEARRGEKSEKQEARSEKERTKELCREPEVFVRKK